MCVCFFFVLTCIFSCQFPLCFYYIYRDTQNLPLFQFFNHFLLYVPFVFFSVSFLYLTFYFSTNFLASFPFRNQKNKSKIARSALNKGITKSSNNCLTFHVSIFFSVYSLIVFNLVCCFLLFNSGPGCNVTHYTDLFSLLYFFFTFCLPFFFFVNLQFSTGKCVKGKLRFLCVQ